MLPLYEWCAPHPFCAFVVNLCACTKGHRDTVDELWCGTYSDGVFKGGQIALYEAGIVLDSNPMEMVVFQSQKETHFNLHIQGIRTSIVAHSDRAGDSWGENYNRWSSHVH
jgi:hypothetical protein